MARCLGDLSNGAVMVSKSVWANGNRDGCLLQCSFGKRMCYCVETALSARVEWWSHSCYRKRRKRRPEDSFVDLESGRLVPMEETLALGADDWMGSNADGTGAPGADGPRAHLDVPRPKEK